MTGSRTDGLPPAGPDALLQIQALENQSLGGRNLRNEQGERNAASELCTAKQVEILRWKAKSGAFL
jgi:hypothetical protein